MKKILHIILFVSFMFPGTIFISQSFSDPSEYITDLTKTSTAIELDETISIGYHHNVWQKRKVRYAANLGIEVFLNDNIKFLATYIMGTYKLNNKKVFLYATLGMDFYEHEYSQINPHEDPNASGFNNEYSPNTKGGYTYGAGVTYLITKKVPLAFDYKILEASEVHDNRWEDINYARASIQIGYKF